MGLSRSWCWGRISEPNRLKKTPHPHEVWGKTDSKQGNQVGAPGYNMAASTLEERKAGKGSRRLAGDRNFK